jgi:hypothetical protein
MVVKKFSELEKENADLQQRLEKAEEDRDHYNKVCTKQAGELIRAEGVVEAAKKCDWHDVALNPLKEAIQRYYKEALQHYKEGE